MDVDVMTDVTGGIAPINLIPLDSVEGNETLKRVYNAKGANKRMVEGYTKQVGNFSCGIASLALLINAIEVAYRIKYSNIVGDKEKEKEFFRLHESGHRFHVDENDITNHKTLNKYLLSTNIKSSGLTLKQLQNIALYLGFGSNIYFVSSSAVWQTERVKKRLETSFGEHTHYYQLHDVDKFRRFAMDYILRPVTGLIVNYDMSALRDKGMPGHFSPLAAYDKEDDLFLVMDVWKDNKPVWVKTEDLFTAMSTVDEESGLPRGILHVHELLY